MLDSIWCLRGSVPLNQASSNKATFDGLEHLLNRQRKTIRTRTADEIAFDDQLWRSFFGPNWLAMIMFDRGRFWIESSPAGKKLQYELRSLHAAIFCSCGSLMFLLFGLANGGLLSGLKFAIAVFSWVYGMNVVLAYIRVPSAIERVAADAVRTDGRRAR